MINRYKPYKTFLNLINNPNTRRPSFQISDTRYQISVKVLWLRYQISVKVLWLRYQISVKVCGSDIIYQVRSVAQKFSNSKIESNLV